jgi:hypothetical protein
MERRSVVAGKEMGKRETGRWSVGLRLWVYEGGAGR